MKHYPSSRHALMTTLPLLLVVLGCAVDGTKNSRIVSAPTLGVVQSVEAGTAEAGSVSREVTPVPGVTILTGTVPPRLIPTPTHLASEAATMAAAATAGVPVSAAPMPSPPPPPPAVSSATAAVRAVTTTAQAVVVEATAQALVEAVGASRILLKGGGAGGRQRAGAC